MPLLNKMDTLIAGNDKVNEIIKNLKMCRFYSGFSEKNLDNFSLLDGFSKEIFNLAIQHSRQRGRRYNYEIKLFSSYLFLVGGRLLYETLSKNLPIPSVTSVTRFIHSSSPPILEGNLRTKELKLFFWIQENWTIKFG